MSQSSWPMDPEWTRGDWSQARQVVDCLSSAEVDRALETLRDIYPPDWVHARGYHPVAAKQHTWPGRVALIELGHAASSFANEKDVERLRDPEEFPSTLPELSVALMASRSAASVTRPLSLANQKEFEFLAQYSNGQMLALEVKTPRPGKEQVLFQQLEAELLFPLMARLPIPESLRARVTIHFESSIAEVNDPELLEQCLTEAETCVRVALESGVIARIAIGRLGWIEIQLDESCDRAQYDAFGVHVAENAEGRRVRRSVLNKAAKQLATSEHAGIVVVNLSLNPLLRNAI